MESENLNKKVHGRKNPNNRKMLKQTADYHYMGGSHWSTNTHLISTISASLYQRCPLVDLYTSFTERFFKDKCSKFNQ